MNHLLKRHILLGCLLIFACWATVAVAELKIPAKPDGYVHDAAGLLSPQVKHNLSQHLQNFERQTSNQIVVATFPSLSGGSLEDFSIRLAEAWQVGQKEKDNGVIFLIFPQEKQMRIEVGYGLEGVLPDALAGTILNRVVAPQFQQGNFENGILQGVAAIFQAVKGEYQATNGSSHTRNSLSAQEVKQLRHMGEGLFTLVLILVCVLFLADLYRYRRYKKNHSNYRGGYSFGEWWFRFALLLFALNILFRVLFYAMLFSRGGVHGSRVVLY